MHKAGVKLSNKLLHGACHLLIPETDVDVVQSLCGKVNKFQVDNKSGKNGNRKRGFDRERLSKQVATEPTINKQALSTCQELLLPK